MNGYFINYGPATGPFFYGRPYERRFHYHSDTQYVLGLVADQNPGHPANAWWFNFFGKPTPFVKGPAKGAVQNDTAVVFAFVHKPRRGYYEAVFSTGCENASSLTEQN